MVCKKCNLPKEEKDFYKTRGIKLDTTCKECVKERSRIRHHILSSNEDWVEKERERHKDKYHRLGYKEQQKEWDKDKPWKNTSTYKNLKRDMKVDKGLELHHWNYNDEYLEDIFILNTREHRILHNSLFLDIEKRIFYLEDGTYLDTKEKHKNFILQKKFKIH